MRQVLEPPRQDVNLDIIEGIVGALLRHSTDEEEFLQQVAQILAAGLEYAAVFLITVESDQQLFLRASTLRVSDELTGQLQPRLQDALKSDHPLLQASDGEQGKSLVLRALGAGSGLEADDLSQLLFPLLDEEEVMHWQQAAGIQRVLAQPFALQDDVRGCVMVATMRPAFREAERRLLQTISQHVALGMRNARLYWRLEEQRRMAQTFAQMAFSGSAYLHTLRNQIGALRTYLVLVQALPHMRPQQREEVIGTSQKAMESLDQAAEILDHLHEPWRRHPHVTTDVNDCLTKALLKLFRELTIQPGRENYVTKDGVQIAWRLADDLPKLETSPEMLTEAFRIVLRNAVDALKEKASEDRSEDSRLSIATSYRDTGKIVVTVADNGTGIAPGDLAHIFELGWTTKKSQGMGFGLFWTRNFVEGLGGRIEVDSVYKEGASFRFVIPASTDVSSPDA